MNNKLFLTMVTKLERQIIALRKEIEKEINISNKNTLIELSSKLLKANKELNNKIIDDKSYIDYGRVMRLRNKFLEDYAEDAIITGMVIKSNFKEDEFKCLLVNMENKVLEDAFTDLESFLQCYEVLEILD